ncbi:tetratricopeptide repeat protein [Bacteroidota bacterium]
MMGKVKYNRKKDTKKNEIFESSEALAEQLSKSERFVEENKTLVFGLLGAIMLAITGYFVFNYYINNQNEQAQIDMFQAVYYFEGDSLNKALNGDGNNYGFLDIIDNYGITSTANLAHFYAGAIYIKQGDFETAIEHLKKFSAQDIAIQARAYSLIGDANMELGNYNKAATQYLKAANDNANEFMSPQYLEKAGLAYERMMDYESATECYSKIVDNYTKSTEYQNARKQKARLESLASK